MSYFDENGLLHVRKGEDSENGILFLAQYASLKVLQNTVDDNLYDKVAKALETSEEGPNLFNSNPKNPVTRFSHDNMTGVYSLAYQFGLRDELKKLPILYWNGRYWLHPRDIIYYTLLRNSNNILGFALLLMLVPFLIVSLMAPKEVTSGKCLWFLRIVTLFNCSDNIEILASKILRLASFILAQKGESWDDIFAYYFKEIDHPVNVEWRNVIRLM